MCVGQFNLWAATVGACAGMGLNVRYGQRKEQTDEFRRLPRKERNRLLHHELHQRLMYGFVVGGLAGGFGGPAAVRVLRSMRK